MTESWTRRVAVVTGGASGMGKAMARRFGAAGAKVAIADIEEPAIAETVAELEALGTEAVGVATDVSDAAAMDRLAASVGESLGPPDIVCLNAGVGAGGPMGELSIHDWAWVLDVNLWGVIHGIRAFLPGLEQRDRGHIVVTSSVAGILSYPMMGPYNASKHAVLAIAETLHNELRQKGSNVRVSALCPGLVNTRILESGRNRHERYVDPDLEAPTEADEVSRRLVADIYAGALEPDAVADMVHDAIQTGRFYILTDHVFDAAIAQRHRDIEQRADPSLTAHILQTHMEAQGGSRGGPH